MCLFAGQAAQKSDAKTRGRLPGSMGSMAVDRDKCREVGMVQWPWAPCNALAVSKCFGGFLPGQTNICRLIVPVLLAIGLMCEVDVVAFPNKLHVASLLRCFFSLHRSRSRLSRSVCSQPMAVLMDGDGQGAREFRAAWKALADRGTLVYTGVFAAEEQQRGIAECEEL